MRFLHKLQHTPSLLDSWFLLQHMTELHQKYSLLSLTDFLHKSFNITKILCNLYKLNRSNNIIASVHKSSSALTLPLILNVQELSSKSTDTMPDKCRACWMLAPWVPIARPARSARTVNSSWKAACVCSRVVYHTQQIISTKQPK